MITTRRIRAQDHAAILEVARALPEWFNADARGRAIPADLRHQPGFVALVDGEVAGFVTLYFAEGRLNIGWLGVRPDYHRRKVGARLLACAEAYGRQHRLTELATSTLGAGVDYPPYEATRQFYFSQGFTVYQTATTDNPGCPEEIKIKKEIGPRQSAPAGSPTADQELR
jgi:GNAT superfamily N-acetyltransferase